MVRLEKISVQGFKSFKRLASIPFPTNFSVVTGPNGSGKSNIADAISFVLGKTSSKILRAKKSQDLIFNGSRKKEGADYAKVTLYFSNKDKVLPFDTDTVTISRRINKSGVSAYRLNGKIVTRQQILDVFTKARIQPGGHNILKQGAVTQIIEMDPVERRTVLDEISGITEYEEKKKKALNELEKIAVKVREAEIVVEQKGEIMSRLSAEREAALKYQNFEKELNKVRLSIIWKEFSSTEKSMEEIEQKINEKQSEYDRSEKTIQELDIKIEAKENELEDAIRDAMNISEQVDLTKKISRLESGIESKKNAIDANNREIERLEALINDMRQMDSKRPPAVEAVLNIQGVHGVLKDLIIVPDKYAVAADVAGGAHMSDVIVENANVAVNCIRYLKENQIGRARFLPMDRIQQKAISDSPEGSFGWISDLVHHEPKYSNIVRYVFGTTACVSTIENAKEISKTERTRMVTIDGDLVESTGAMTGGFYIKKSSDPRIRGYNEQKKKISSEIKILIIEIEELEAQLKELLGKEKKSSSANLEGKRAKLKEQLEKLRSERKSIYEKRIIIQQELNKININKARLEAKRDSVKEQWGGKQENDIKEMEESDLKDKSVQWLKGRENEIMGEFAQLGPVNMKAIEDYDSLYEEFKTFKEKVEKIIKEKLSIEETIAEVDSKRHDVFKKTLEAVSQQFLELYNEMTGGDAYLKLEKEGDIESGLLISAQPPGKKLLYIDSMSGGEKTLTALAFLFAIQRHKPSPFYILDEADAALDKTNTIALTRLIQHQSKMAQFIVVSHNIDLVRKGDTIYGVSMDEGESKVIGLNLTEEDNLKKLIATN
ncbi:MAG: chromosome segregation protein SMC [Candidatus Aenigmarchaeota archaeon]|nr:chromosome segregation protein SMC [Candidatus Aenigmarchaeota archaeon]